MKATGIDSTIYGYLEAHHSSVDPVLEELRRETHGTFGRQGGMQISPDQGIFLRTLVASMGARLVVEVGTFTGYSALCMAQGLAPGGKLITCDVNPDTTAIARRYWDCAGVGDRIESRLGPGIDTLRSLPEQPSIDFAFIDADKRSYAAYYEEILRRLRPSGLIAIDNALWSGRVLEASSDADTEAIRTLNAFVAKDARVECVLLAVGDGLMLARRRA